MRLHRALIALSLCWPLLLVSQASFAQTHKPKPAPQPSQYTIERPTIIAFFLPSQVMKEDDSDAKQAAADFKEYVTQAKEPLQKLGVEIVTTSVRSFRVHSGDATAAFHATQDVGYYFVAPGKEPRIEYGLMSDVDLLQTAREYFEIKFREP